MPHRTIACASLTAAGCSSPEARTEARKPCCALHAAATATSTAGSWWISPLGPTE
ncbi:zinc-finger homeodomain protein 3 [Phtheirospermum japonicum]|uniref:Zinc-finger homeodomain protein 3 n=1 Tax=Phtheirospermum japonicum TaxID=374723 RepID=A0A830CQP1_9LAMI|nr:zinc-finger homeodomain protein 3 [Phtheirospermum japonicum]